MIEIWKDIKGYEGEYQISNMGKVKSFLGKKERILKYRYTNRYCRVSLHKGNDSLIHRLVAEAFIPNPDNLPEVNHKDENPLNNCADNLEWCSHKYNLNYGTCNIRRALHTKESGKMLNHINLSKPVKCNETGAVYKSINDAARELHLYPSVIGMCCRGKRKSHGGLSWSFAETH